MKKNSFHNSRENRINTVFKPRTKLAGLFSGVCFILLVLVGVGLTVHSVSIAAPGGKIAPQRETIIVFPSYVTSVNWENVDTLASQDLGDFAIYQNFSTENSAFIVTDSVQPPSPVETESPAAPEQPTDANSDVIVPSVELPATQPETLDESVPADTSSSTVFGFPTHSSLALILATEEKVLPLATLLPLAQAVTTTPVVEPTLEPLPIVVEEVVEMPIVETSTESTSTPIEIEVPESQEEAAASTSSNEFVEEIPDVLIDATTTTLEELVPEEPVADTVPEVTDIEEIPPVDFGVSNHSITLRDFSLPKLASGQFIDNLQLRLSMAGRYDAAPGEYSGYVSAEYSLGDFEHDSGSVIVEEEVSNAVNGGYFVLPLPSIKDPSLLKDLKVKLSFYGEDEQLESLFVDAVWLEIETVVYDKKLLLNRTLPDNLRQLLKPRVFNFLSDEIDFAREDVPSFSLRYESQRNFVVQAVRSLFSSNFVTVERVSFFKRNGERIELNPDVLVTEDGIINIAIPDEEKDSLQPGTYTVEVVVDEGGVLTTDSFQFQWGLLTINTNQTQYTSGNVVEVAMGALQNNGNTICNANLNLYVTNPAGFIDSVPVAPSGQCFGNNVVDVPDYSTAFVVDEFGTYELYLERVDDDGNILSHTTMSFDVVPNQEIVIERDGPTRIYPLAPYTVDLTVHGLSRSFNGQLVERVPSDFDIFDTTAEIRVGPEYTELVWDISMMSGTSESVSYTFDAPDVSPYLFTLGPARLESEETTTTEIVTEPVVDEFGSTTVQGSTQTITSQQINVVFEEHRQWQIASDALQPGVPLLNQTPAFDNIMVTTTQPVIGGFRAIDPDGDVVQYELQVDNDQNFSSPVFTRTSSNYPSDAGWTAATFASGATTTYQVQSADALTDGTTYWWRVRARDPFDTNTWTSYSTPRSLTINTSSVAPRWHQTLGWQFNNDTLTDAATSTGAVSIRTTPSTPTVVSATTNSANNNILTLTKPSNVAVGDLLVIIVGNEDTTNTDQWDNATFRPTGFTLINEAGDTNSDAHVGAFYRVADGTEGTTVDVPAQASGDYWGTYLRVTGASTTNPINIVGADATAVSATQVVNSVTTTGTNILAFYALAGDGADTAPFSIAGTGWVEGGEITAGAGANAAAGVWGTRFLASGGASGNATVGMAANDGAAKFQFALNPAIPSQAVVRSPEIDFDWVSGQNSWGDITWNVTEPTGTDTYLRVYYTNVSTCDTLVPEIELPGNAAGIDIASSSMYIYTLSTSTYNRICVEMTLNKGTGTTSPTLNDWTVRFDLPNQGPIAPTLDVTPAFDNLFATTTPTLGGFQTSDYESDDMEFEIVIDNNYDFSSPVLTRTSSNYPSDAGWSAATFASYATTTYTVQPADALTDGVTYWWKVRGRDPSGSNTWSDYSTERSFTVDAGLLERAWHQTTEEQFVRSTLTNATTTSGGGVEFESIGTTNLPVIESYTSDTAVPGTTVTMNLPAGTTAGDLLLVLVGNDAANSGAQWNASTLTAEGFTLIDEQGDNTTDAHVAAFYKIADGTETATLDVDAASSQDYWGFYIRISGVDPSDPFDQFGSPYLGGNVTGKTIPGITTVNDNELALFVLAADDGNQAPFSVSAPWSEEAEIQAGTLAGNASGVWGSRGMVSPGATGDVSITSSGANGAAGFAFAFNPEPATGGTVMSSEIDFAWVAGQDDWGLVDWGVTEPAGTDSFMRLYYSNVSACDTLIPDIDLPGNSAGFDYTGINMFIDSLSTTTYDKICMEVELTALSTTTSPTLEYWSLKWVIPNQLPYPTQLAETPAFESYRATTTTPTLGGFTTTDYEEDNFQYQIVIDNDYDFSSPVLTRTSSNYPSDAGWSAATFSANATTTYTIQPADALTNGATYWWKVRAIDPLGSNEWGEYSTPRSITINTSKTVPDWFQTTSEQFQTGTLNSTYISAGGVLVSPSPVQVAELDAWTSGTTKTISTGGDRLLLVAVISEDPQLDTDVNTVTYGGQTLTELADQQIGTGFSNGMWVGYLDEAGINAASNTTISPSWTTTAPGNGLQILSAVYEDVNQDTPVRSHSSNALTSGASISPTAAVDVLSGDMMIYINESANGLTHTPESGYTEAIEEEIIISGDEFVGAVAYKSISSDGTEYPTADWSASGNRLLMTALSLAPSPESGTIMSPEIDFDWVTNQTDWGEVIWHVTEPTGSAVLLSVYYTNVTTCDTLVPDGALTGNSAGIASGGSPLDISGLSTSTYNRICLSADLSKGTSDTSPTLEDWAVTWDLSPVYEQSGFWWFNNADNTNPTDTWPVGATAFELTENDPIISSHPTKYNDVLRLRMGVGVTSVTASGVAFKLQYAEGLTCSPSLEWFDVGPIGSTTALWRGYNNTPSDGATLSSSKLSGTDVLETYEEQNDSAAIPNNITSGQFGEWDWVLQNRALPGTNYCFRMVTPDGNRFKTYTNYPSLITNEAPEIANNAVPFDNQKTASTSPWFEFTGVDAEGESIDYQIQIDNNYDFSSTLVDHNSITNFTYFENQQTLSDKSPFNDSELIRYTTPTSFANGVTYWWRVRAIDSAGSAQYGDWTTPKSFTIDTSVTVTTWFQTTEEQFDTDTLVDTDATGSDNVTLAPSFSTGTTTSTAIDFDDVVTGNSWGLFSFTETGAANNILYHLEYFDGNSWTLIPDGDLAGNAAGYDTSPVDLIDLDTETYNLIRIRANFLAGSPTIEDWTVTWGQRVSVPTHLLLFDNEKTGTTTPTFTFFTTDLEGDDLEYELSISTDNTFVSGSTTVNSSSSPGFINLDNGGDTSPFNTGDTISYQVQSALTNGVTYWWRLRARDPNGGNSYSFWSDPWSFTVDITATTSTWFQTTQEQFETDTLSSTIASTTDSVSTIAASVSTYNFNGVTGPSASHVARDFEVAVNDPTDPPTFDAIDTLTVLGTTAGAPNLRSGIAGYASDAEATTAQYGQIASSDNVRWTITNPGAGDNAVFWASFDIAEDPANIDQIVVTLEGYQGSATDVAWLGIWRPGSTTPYWQALDWFQQTGTDGTYTGTITTNIDEYLDAQNKIHVIFFNEDDGDSLFVDYIEVEVTSNTADSGTVIGNPLDFDDGSGPAWGQMYWTDVEPGSSSLLYQVQYLNGVGDWVLIPNTDLPGNAAGFGTAPIDLKFLNTTTYNEIRPVANFTCVAANCPTLNDWTIEWSRGFSISGTAVEYDGVTPVNSGTVAVAVNGVLQIGKTGTISSGSWTIDNVTYFSGDVVTVFVSDTADADEAVAVTKYDGTPDITGMRLQKRHVTLGSDDLVTISNANIGAYDFTADEDLFFDVNGSNVLSMCADAGCADAGIVILSGNTYTPGANLTTHDMDIEGTLATNGRTIRVNGSWFNTGTTTLTNSTVIMTATSTSETINTSGAVVGSFNNLTFGETSGTATWTLANTLDVNGGLVVSFGTLARGVQEITVAGSLTTGAAGFWTGIGTTTFDGSSPATWTDNNATDQNIGRVVVDGSTKALLPGTSAVMQSLTIGSNDTFDLNNRTIYIYEGLNNQNTFIPRTGTVIFAATTPGYTIVAGSDPFYNLTFNGVGGTWSFTESDLTVSNDLVVATGTVTMPTGTTTIAGSFNATGGAFQNNNGTLYFTSTGPETITFAGGAFTNVAYNMTFSGTGGVWTMNDVNATSTNDFRVSQGTVVMPSGTLAVGGSFIVTNGTLNANSGTLRLYSTSADLITLGGDVLNNVVIDGVGGSWTVTDANADFDGNLSVLQGSLTLPSGNLNVGGSYINTATVVPGTGTVVFDSTDTGETINFGAGSLYNVTFNGVGGGWTVSASATTTNNFTLTNANNWSLSGGSVLSVGNVFTNSVGGASTTWTGSTLALRGGDYTINSKSVAGDAYNTLLVDAGARVAIWNSSATSYSVNASASLYSQDHAGVNGDLYIFGAYTRSSGNEYWSYATDFDGIDLTGGSERQVDVRFADGASATFNNVSLSIQGTGVASTTADVQSTGTYVITVNGGTTTAQYYSLNSLGLTGLSLNNGTIVPLLRDGEYEVDVSGGTAITLSSTTIDANPGKQISNVTFATTTAISATNVTQTDGTPASFWWFRDGHGNLYGEAYDNDTGDPGSVRFDDSSLTISVSGTVYTDAGVTELTGGTCDGSTPVVRVLVNGVSQAFVSCSNIDGSFTAPGVSVIGDPTLTVFLDDASGGEHGSVITRTPTANITNLDIYTNRVIVRNEDVGPLMISNLAVYDADNDDDLRFTASTSTVDSLLTVFPGNELYVFASSTFEPQGSVVLDANASLNSYDGSLYVAPDATFTSYATSTYTIGGNMTLATGASFTPASSTVTFTATTTGKTLSSVTPINFYNVDFNGSGGEWTLNADLDVDSDMQVLAGTVTGTGDIAMNNGSLTGNGTLLMTGGTTTIATSTTLGGTSPWTFFNLQLGDGILAGTTTPAFTSTTTVNGVLTIASAHFLDAGATTWELGGTGNVFIENGTFLEDTSTVRYSGAGANVRSTPYYNLDINAQSGSPTFTATGLGIVVGNNLTVGGVANTTFDINTNDVAFDVNGDVIIASNGTLSTSNSAAFTIAGNYDNNGTLTANGGTITFDGAGTSNIAAGNSSFANVIINGTADVSVTEHATTTGAFTLTNVNSFAVSSGQSLTVAGVFSNAIGGAATTWTGSTLRLIGGGDYSINASTTADSYDTLSVGGGTHIRMWNSDASVYDVFSTGSLYSQDHAAVDGDLYIWGAYQKTSATDYWSYATDFDGTALGGSSRKVDVYINDGSSVTVTGGQLRVIGATNASTTIQNQGTGSYGLTVGGNTNTTFQYYEVRDTNSSGLVFTGSPTISTLSNGDYEVSQNGGTAITVGGTVITQNPAKNFNLNRFALDGVGSGFNVTATGTTVSSWRFVNHYGGLDGEANDVDPDGDPGYIAWDDSAALITISGRVYNDTIAGASAGCTSGVVRLVVAGLSSATTTCDTGTGAYTFSNISYGPTDSLIVYIDGVSQKGATVTKEPISNIANLDIYENHVIVRHENTDAMTIADMAIYDSSDDVDIPFTAVDAGTDTLTLPADRKLIVWNAKTFTPTGNVTLTNGGSQSYGGSLQLYGSATWQSTGTELLSIGGSMTLDAGATFTPATGTTTFTTAGSGRTIDVNENSFYNLAFTGAGSWTASDATLSVDGNFSMTGGTLTFPTGTSTFSGSFTNAGGSFNANSGTMVFDGTGTRTVAFGGSSASTVEFFGNYTFTDANATTTNSLTINSGTVTLPSGRLAVGGDFENLGGSVTHNTSEIVFTNVTGANLLASSSDLYAVTFSGGGSYVMLDENLSLLDSLIISNGSVTLASTTLAIGGSLDATGGTFTAGSSTILFNSNDGGELIDAGASLFYNVIVAAPTGGYSLIGNATTTHNFTLSTASNFTVSPGVTLKVEGVFLNNVSGTNTTWTGSTLALDGQNAYSINSKSVVGDQYETLIIGANSDIRVWNSSATTTIVDSSSSLYSQDHASSNGALSIFGDFHISTTTEYWSYATDFDGADLSGGGERVVTVSHSANATTTLDGGVLHIVGANSNETLITNQGSGTFALEVSDGTFNALYYQFRNLTVTGLNLSGTPTIASLSFGDFELAVDGGSLITLSSTTLNANASLVISGNRFATTTAISGANVELVGVTSNAWTFVSHTGNLDGENYDIDDVSLCGSIRWDDSACLLTQQTNYRWRNDDGGLGVPDSEWYNSNWNARQRVRLQNPDVTDYTDAVVQLFVPYDSDMQADFDDLVFTDITGTDVIPHWLGSTTDSVTAEVWVRVPELAGEDTTNIFMYYDNPTATTTSSSTLTFNAADDFEDDNISEYSGQTSLFGTDTSFVYDGSYGLDNAGSESSRANLGGIYRFDQTVQRGETFRFLQYIDTSAGSGDETCTLFGVQSPGSTHENYAVCLEQFGTDRISLVKDAVDNDASGSILATSTVTYTTGWYEVEVDWATSSIDVYLYDESDSLVASISATDTDYASGGFGFTFWFHNGGWDSVSSRKTLTTEPTVLFGVEQTDGGATWKAAQNTVASYDIGDVARLRIAIENTGVDITDQEFLLEFAPQDTAPSCEAVDPSDYIAVPPAASCGTSAICMTDTTNYANGDQTVDLLEIDENLFTFGEARENNSNITGLIDVDQGEYTELEYALTPTVNFIDEDLCFRLTDNGADYDTYLRVGKLNLRFEPTIAGVTLNNGTPIALLPGTTTQVYATGTVTDLNGYTDLTTGTTTFYRGGVAGAASCTPDNNNCYVATGSQCEFVNCAGNSCEFSCYADIYFHADPTDTGSAFEGQEWFAFMEVEDASAGYDFETSIGQVMSTLRAIDVVGQIDYGSLEVTQDTGSSNASTSVSNLGNVEVDIEIQGTDLSDGATSVIPADQQKFSTTTFTYSSCGAVCELVSSTSPVTLDVDLTKPTVSTPPVEDDVFWGIYVPFGISSTPHQGYNVFTPISP